MKFAKNFKNTYFEEHLSTTASVINENALSLATNLSIVTLILCMAKSIDQRKWGCSYTDLSKNI